MLLCNLFHTGSLGHHLNTESVTLCESWTYIIEILFFSVWSPGPQILRTKARRDTTESTKRPQAKCKWTIAEVPKNSQHPLVGHDSPNKRNRVMSFTSVAITSLCPHSQNSLSQCPQRNVLTPRTQGTHDYYYCRCKPVCFYESSLCRKKHLQQNDYLWYRDSVILGFCDTANLWYRDSAILGFCDTVNLWYQDSAMPEICDAGILRYGDSVILQFSDTGVLWTLILWYPGSVLLWFCDMWG